MFSSEPLREDEVTSDYRGTGPVRGAPAVRSGTRLPLEAHVESAGVMGGWTIRLPVRKEHVTTYKRPVVVEEVSVYTTQVDDTVRIDETVRHEELRVDNEGDVRVTERRTDAPPIR